MSSVSHVVLTPSGESQGRVPPSHGPVGLVLGGFVVCANSRVKTTGVPWARLLRCMHKSKRAEGSCGLRLRCVCEFTHTTAGRLGPAACVACMNSHGPVGLVLSGLVVCVNSRISDWGSHGPVGLVLGGLVLCANSRVKTTGAPWARLLALHV